MVIVKDIEMFSMCEHHMVPFIGKVRSRSTDLMFRLGGLIVGGWTGGWMDGQEMGGRDGWVGG